MAIQKTLLFVAAVLSIALPQKCMADHGSYAYQGGSFSTGVAAGQAITVQNASMTPIGGTLSFSCTITGYDAGTYQIVWNCAGGSVTIATPNKSVVFKGAFTSGSMAFSCSGGGRGGHVSCSYQFSGQFSGTITANGVTQAANGSAAQYVNTTSQLGSKSAPVRSGDFGWNSGYSPVLIGDSMNGRILGADNITGANFAKFGTWGSGTGQFEAISGIAQDVSGRIYITDSALNRLVRIDDLTGKNWEEIGSLGSGNNHFNGPLGVAIDSTGNIWVADAGNNRIVRFDDMTGSKWTSFGTPGTGSNQFYAPAAIAFDAHGRIYVADSGNNRLVRFDDLTGKNWVSLTEVHSGAYAYFLTLPDSVAINLAGQIYIALNGGYLLRVDDMTGANLSLSNWGNTLSAISVDKAGTVYVAGIFSPGLAQVVDATGAGYFASGLGGAVTQPTAVFASASSEPPPAAPVLSPSALAFNNQNVGEHSAARSAVLVNLGSAPLTLDSIAASSDFLLKNNCSSPLAGGASCIINVQFEPIATGARKANLSVTSNGVHPMIDLPLTGTGTSPKALVLPGSLGFDAQATGKTSSAETVTLTNSGSGPLTIASIATAGDFTQTNNCGKVVPAGNGCTLQVNFHPTATGARTGSLTISDDAVPSGAHQVVSLAGTGTTTAPSFTLSPESLQFPPQQIKVASSKQTVTLTNNSGAKALFKAPTYSAGFTGSSNCGSSLATGARCIFSLQFDPTVAGAVTGSVTIPITGKPALTIGLSGTGTPASNKPALSINPSSLNFGQVVYGDDLTLSVTITNPLGVATGIRSISLTGASGFSITGNNCPSILGGGASCTVSIIFVSTSTSPYSNSGTLTVTESTGAQSQVPLSAVSGSDGGGGI